MPRTFGAPLIVVRIDPLTTYLHRYRAMHKYDFTLILAASLELTDGLARALFLPRAATTERRAPVMGYFPLIFFHREAPSLEEAIRSAIEDVRLSVMQWHVLKWKPKRSYRQINHALFVCAISTHIELPCSFC